MPRLKQAGREAGNDFANLIFDLLFEDRDPIKEPGTATGTPGNWWTVFNIVPDAFKHTTEGFQFYRSPDRKLDAKLRELGQTRAQDLLSVRSLCFRSIVKPRAMSDSQKSRLVPSLIGLLQHCFSEIERAVLAYTDALVLQRGRVPDGVFEILKAHLSDEEILEFTYVTCTYMMHAVMSRALKLEYDDVDDRIVEIPAPSGDSADVMSMVDTEDK